MCRTSYTLKGFSPECVFMCLLRQEAVVQKKSHCLQLKGFSSEWVSMSVLRLSPGVQEKLHTVQLKSFFLNELACVS